MICIPSAVEKALIHARYVLLDEVSLTDDLTTLEIRYAAAMKEAFVDFPDDLDVADLFAESLMNQAPWRLCCGILIQQFQLAGIGTSYLVDQHYDIMEEVLSKQSINARSYYLFIGVIIMGRITRLGKTVERLHDDLTRLSISHPEVERALTCGRSSLHAPSLHLVTIVDRHEAVHNNR